MYRDETEKLQEVFQTTAGMLGENQPHDVQRMQNSPQTVMKSQAAFLEAVREVGVCNDTFTNIWNGRFFIAEREGERDNTHTRGGEITREREREW